MALNNTTFPTVYCPFCRAVATGTIENIPGIAALVETEGGLEYGGETKVEWDNQETEVDDRGLTIFWCQPCGKTFGVELPEEDGK